MKKSFTPLGITGTNKRNKKFLTGFTLIELLIVLIIIGILVTLAVPQYKNFVERAQAAEAKAVLNALADSVWRYYLEGGTWPPPAVPGPGNVIPDCLDVHIPLSKYFTYMYVVNSPGCYVIAIRKKWEELPVGETAGYIIFFFNYRPSGDYRDFQKLDDTWTKYYAHSVVERPGFSSPQPNWD